MTTRLHARLFGALWPSAVPEDGGAFQAVQVASPVRHALQRQLDAPGAWRGGPLYGAVADHALQLDLAVPGGYRCWMDDPLEGDARYQLGWADAVRSLHVLDIDWVGNWLIRPDNRLPSTTECESWVRRGASTGLFDDRHILLACGLADSRLAMTACRLVDGDVEVIQTVH